MLQIQHSPGDVMASTIRYLLVVREEGRLFVDPPFQRGSVWSHEQRVAWVETLLDDLPRPPLFINESSRGAGPYGDTAVVIDGRQRVEATLAFIDGGLQVRGERYPDQPEVFKRTFKGLLMPVVRTQFKTERECQELYVKLLRCGTAHTEDEIARAEAMLRGE